MVQGTENQQGIAHEPLTMKALLEAGVHFGHPTRRWHPRMKTYIYTQRNGIHIIDLQQTLKMLDQACQFVADLVAQGGKVMFVGTKKQAQESVAEEAQRCGMFYVSQRWLGGTLTNFATIRGRIAYMKELEEREKSGMLQALPKKEAQKLVEKLQRLRKYLNGIRDLEKYPDALFVIDVVGEDIAVSEARRVGVPIVALVDTDANPDLVNHIIPGNDDAIRSIRLVCSRIADAALDGRRRHEESLASAKAAAQEEAVSREAEGGEEEVVLLEEALEAADSADTEKARRSKGGDFGDYP